MEKHERRVIEKAVIGIVGTICVGNKFAADVVEAARLERNVAVGKVTVERCPFRRKHQLVSSGWKNRLLLWMIT